MDTMWRFGVTQTWTRLRPTIAIVAAGGSAISSRQPALYSYNRRQFDRVRRSGFEESSMDPRRTPSAHASSGRPARSRARRRSPSNASASTAPVNPDATGIPPGRAAAPLVLGQESSLLNERITTGRKGGRQICSSTQSTLTVGPALGTWHSTRLSMIRMPAPEAAVQLNAGVFRFVGRQAQKQGLTRARLQTPSENDSDPRRLLIPGSNPGRPTTGGSSGTASACDRDGVERSSRKQ